ADASTAFGIVRIAPLRRRLMLLPSNALELLLNSAISIWSSVTVSGLYWPAILDSVSPFLTSYVPPSQRGAGAAPVGAVAAAAAVGAGAGAAAACCWPRGATVVAAPGRTGVMGSTDDCCEPGGSSRNV